MYFAQEVMEGIRSNGYIKDTTPTKYWCVNNNGCVSVEDIDTKYNAIVVVNAVPKMFKGITSSTGVSSFEVTVTASSLSKGHNTDEVELVNGGERMNEKGVTLIELLVVILIMSFILWVPISLFNYSLETEKGYQNRK